MAINRGQLIIVAGAGWPASRLVSLRLNGRPIRPDRAGSMTTALTWRT